MTGGEGRAALTVIGRRPPHRVAYEAKLKVRLDLSRSHLELADFKDGNFTGADFSYAHLNGSMFLNADLKYARFMLAELNGAVFVGADLRRADFLGAKDLLAAALSYAKGDAFTQLPRSVTRPTEWPTGE
jgi:hypothetical protein